MVNGRRSLPPPSTISHQPLTISLLGASLATHEDRGDDRARDGDGGAAAAAPGGRDGCGPAQLLAREHGMAPRADRALAATRGGAWGRARRLAGSEWPEGARGCDPGAG